MKYGDTYVYTGGKAFDASKPTVVFIHGAQNDHSVWGLQSRYFAYHGFNVLAPDLPGHGRSGGTALTTVEAMASWLVRLLDDAGAASAMLVGHSMGSLIAMEAAHQAPSRVTRLALVGTAYPMKVSDALLNTARDNEPAAIAMVAAYSHSSLAQKPAAPGPGSWVIGGAIRLMERMSARNPAQLFYTDFSACNSYANDAAAGSVKCPVLVISGSKDMMTPARAAKGLLTAMSQARTVTLDCGHALMQEQPDGVLDALIGFSREK
jgi:pimeloyl-ACP methyl ester carboxylesterase